LSNTLLLTGAAGFIGFHVAKRLLERGERVVDVDSFTPYYDVALKEARAAELLRHKRLLARASRPRRRAGDPSPVRARRAHGRDPPRGAAGCAAGLDRTHVAAKVV